MTTLAPYPLTESLNRSGDRAAGRNWSRGLAAMAAGTLLLANLVRVDADPDLWGHLLFGLTSLQTGELASSDPYSYTASGSPWTNHEWLTELSFGVVYSAMGVTGLMLLRAVLLTVTVVAIGTIAVRRRLPPTAMVALALFGITVLSQFFRVRPQMFTFALMSLLLLVCDQHRPGRRIGLCLVPVIILFWTNLHAGFVAGLGIFGIHWLGFIATVWQRPDRGQELVFLGLVLFFSLSATLVNPYGIDYWRYVLYAITLPRPAIREWGSVFSHNTTILLCYGTVVLVTAYFWVRSWRTGYWAETACFGLGVVLAAQHGRHLPFLVLFAAVVFARRVPEFLSIHGTRLFEQPARFRPLALLTFSLLVLGTTLGGMTKFVREVTAIPSEGALAVSPQLYPVQAVDFLVRNQISGNLDCGFNWGEYCLFKLYPRCRVFCDGRYETVYPPEVSDLVLGKRDDPETWRRRVDNFPTELILAKPNDRFAEWAMQHRGFVEIYSDRNARLLARPGAGQNALLKKWKQGRLKPPAPAPHAQPFPA